MLSIAERGGADRSQRDTGNNTNEEWIEEVGIVEMWSFFVSMLFVVNF